MSFSLTQSSKTVKTSYGFWPSIFNVTQRGLHIAFILLSVGFVLFLLYMIKFEYKNPDPLLFGYSIFVSAFQISRLSSALFYKRLYRTVTQWHEWSLANGKEPYEPKVTFVVPCKDEEKAIKNTVEKCFEADYPAKKLEVIVINDGSTDNTGLILDSMKEKYGKRLKIIHFKENRGKRHAMTEGFYLSEGEIIIQLDSDSYIIPGTFASLVRLFSHPSVGGVSAHTDPENADENIITKMQSAYYFMSFRILKAAESAYGTVFCCSGCASAYRKSAVMPILEEWKRTTFLGLPVTWGDDRGLTNMVMQQGFITLYTDETLALTVVPDTFKKFLKQQVRWKKGWFVNSIFASKFVIKRDAFVALVYFFPLCIITILTPLMAIRAALIYPLGGQAYGILIYMLGVMLVTLLIVIFYREVGAGNKYWPYIFIWAALNTFLLTFLMFYALATIQDRRWGTR
jgi:hyaluronan synthase